MTTMSRSEIIKALAQYRSGDVLGAPETTSIDFKRGLYALREDKGKHDLCTDVTAMANAAGGIIVCGFKADKLRTEVHEAASAITAVRLADLDTKRHHDVLLQYVWPHVTVGFTWHARSEDDQEHGFLVIEVEPLPEHERYAMVRRFVTRDGKLCEGFTVPIRIGDQTTYPAAEVLHRLFVDGRRLNTMSSTQNSQSAASALSTAELDARIDQRLAAQPSWQELSLPVLIWQSTPERPAAVLNGMYERASGVYGALYNPQTLRESGFFFNNLGNPPRTVAGALVSAEDPRRAIRVDTEGTVTAAALATSDMLGWAMPARSPSAQRLNVIALSEMTLEYFRLVDEQIAPRVTGGWRHRVRVLRFQQPLRVTLGSGFNPTFPMVGDEREASSQEWDRAWTAHGDAERDAYEALRLIYALFGLPDTANPFIVSDRLSTAKLLEAARG